MTSDLDNKLFIFKNGGNTREKEHSTETSKKVKVLEKEKESMSFRESVKKSRSKSKNSHKTTTSKKREGKVENTKSQVKKEGQGKSRDTSKFSLKSKTAKNPNPNTSTHAHSKPTTSSILHGKTGKRLSRKLSFSSRKSTGRVNHRKPNVFDGSGSIISSASSASLTNIKSQSQSQGQSMATINTNSFDSAHSGSGAYGRSFHKKKKSPLVPSASVEKEREKESKASSKENENKSRTLKSAAVSPVPVPVPIKNPGETSTQRQVKQKRNLPPDLIPSPTHRKVIDNVNSMNNSPTAESPGPASNSNSNSNSNSTSNRRGRSRSSKSSKRGRKKSKSRKSHSSSTTTSTKSHSTKKKRTKKTKSKKSVMSTKKLFVRSNKNTDDTLDDDDDNPPALEKLRSRSGSKTEFETSKKNNNHNNNNITIIPSSSFSKNEKTVISKTMSIPSRQWSSTSTTTHHNHNHNKRNKLVIRNSSEMSDSDDGDEQNQDREPTNAYAHKTIRNQVSRKTSTKLEKLVTPDVNKLLQDCECYMNWVPTHRKLNNENMQHFIEAIQTRYLSPPPTGEFVNEDTLRFEPLEHIANLGALCFFHLELNQFKEASETISNTQNFVSQCLRKSVVPKDYIPSFDYIWDFLRLHGSVREWEKTERMTLFPEMNLLSFVTNFDKLRPKIRAGVYGVKQFFYKIMGTAIDKQIQVLRRVISLDRDYFEWPCSLQMALRQQRKMRKHPPSGSGTSTSPLEEMKDELNQSIQAYNIAPNNPRCLLGAIQILTDITKEKMMRDRKNTNSISSSSTSSISKWDTIKFGQDLQFQSPGQVAKFVIEQAKKIIKFAFKSINVNMALADILTNSLPPEYRDYPLGKNCLTRTLKFHPECQKANYKLAVFYLTVEGNYRQAEIYFDTAFSLDEKHWPSLLGLIHCMMKYIVLRQDMILEVITLQLENTAWDKNQIATLHFLKGLVFVATSKTKEAFEEFIYAYELNQSVFTFAELPHLQKKYGWPNSSALTFGNIRLEAQYFKEQHLKEKDRDKKMIISVIIRTLDKAMESEKKSSKHAHKLKSNHNKT